MTEAEYLNAAEQLTNAYLQRPDTDESEADYALDMARLKMRFDAERMSENTDGR